MLVTDVIDELLVFQQIMKRFVQNDENDDNLIDELVLHLDE